MSSVTPKTSRHPHPRRRSKVRLITSPKILLAVPISRSDYSKRTSSRRKERQKIISTPGSSQTVNPTPGPPQDPRDGVQPPPVSAREIQLYLDPRRDEKHKLEQVLRKRSVVYAKKCQKLPKIYQHTQKLRHTVNEVYSFTSPTGQEQYPTLTTKLESLSTTSPPKTPVSGDTTASNSIPSLPKTPFCSPLLRRPITFSPRPLEEQDEGFQAFANRLDLKPLLIDDSPAKTLKFYHRHYPLLLQKLLEEDRDKYADRRSVTPSLGPNARKRGADVGKRLLILDMSLDELDKQTTDGRFFTELRDEIFDPRKWPWNRNRYQ